MNALPALQLLLQAYLNLDWADEYGDPWVAVDDFARSEHDLARALRAEVDHVLTTTASDEDLWKLIVDDFGSGYLPEADGWTYREWLEQVADRVDQCVQQ